MCKGVTVQTIVQRSGTVSYGVATVSRIDSIIGLFCRISSLFWGSFAKETYNLIDPTNQSHPICFHFAPYDTKRLAYMQGRCRANACRAIWSS